MIVPSPDVDGASSTRDPSPLVTAAIGDCGRESAGGKGSRRSVSRDSNGEGNECLICHKPVVDLKGRPVSTPVTKLPCGRIYHKDCLGGWLLKNDEPKGLCVTCGINTAMDYYGGHCERCYGLHVYKCNESCANCEAVYPKIEIRLRQCEGCDKFYCRKDGCDAFRQEYLNHHDEYYCVQCNVYQDECSCKICDNCGGVYLPDGSPPCIVDDHLRIECECQFEMSP